MSEKAVGVFSNSLPREKKSVKLPSGRTVTVLEMTGKEEMLLKTRQDKIYETINSFLCASTENLDENPGHPSVKDFDEMLLEDRAYILMSIRVLTHGSILEHKMKCSECGAESVNEIDLQSILDEAKPYPKGADREVGLRLEIGELFYELPTGATERKVSTAADKNMATLLKCLKLWEKTPQGPIVVRVEDLKSKYTAALRKSVKEHSGSVENIVKVSCSGCGREEMVNVLGERDFLLPNSM